MSIDEMWRNKHTGSTSCISYTSLFLLNRWILRPKIHKGLVPNELMENGGNPLGKCRKLRKQFILVFVIKMRTFSKWAWSLIVIDMALRYVFLIMSHIVWSVYKQEQQNLLRSSLKHILSLYLHSWIIFSKQATSILCSQRIWKLMIFYASCGTQQN